MIGYKGNNGISMGKEGENLDESYVFSVEIIELPDTINSRIALDAIVEMLQMQHFSSEWYAERHELIEKKNIPDPERKACTKSYWIEKDYGAKRKSGIQSPMFIRVYALYCVHPYNKAKLAMIGYSHRYDEGKEDPRFTQKANSFFKNVSLDEF